MLVLCATALVPAQSGTTLNDILANVMRTTAKEEINGDIQKSETGLLDVHVRERDISAILEMLSYQAQANIVATSSVSGVISANLYSVTLEQALDAILTPNGYTFWMTENTIFVGVPDELGVLLPPPETRVYKLQYLRAKDAAKAVNAVLGEHAECVEGGNDDEASGGQQSGGKDEFSPAGGDYLIVTARPDELTAVEGVLAQIDVQPHQVLIEATILRATLNEANQLGIDFTMLGGVDFQDVGSTSNASADLTTGRLPSAQLQDTTFNINTDFAGNITGGGFTFGLIHDSIAGFVRALEDVTDVVVVANPKVVAMDRQVGEVIVGRRDGYLTTTVTETAAIQTVEFLETGTQIRFRPLINDDGTVRLIVHPKDSNGGLTTAQLPFEETTEAQTAILVEDGDTILIGGLFRERTVSSRSQVPFLGDVPGLGLLLGSQSDQTVREEVIILLTVHVLKNTPAEKAEFRALLDDVERIRVGTRRGLFGIGRERLAQAFYHEAVRKLDAGQTDAALLNARMAVHNQPKHLAALKLQERILEERFWDEEGSRMRTFLLDLIAKEGSPDVPPQFGRPHIKVRRVDEAVGDDES